MKIEVLGKFSDPWDGPVLFTPQTESDRNLIRLICAAFEKSDGRIEIKVGDEHKVFEGSPGVSRSEP